MRSWQNECSCRSYVYVCGSAVKCFLVAALLTLFPVHHALAHNFLGEVYPIYIIPENDIFLEYGQPLETSCFLNLSHQSTANRNASNMKFISPNKQYEGVEAIVNETGIRLSVADLDMGETTFHCVLQEKDGPEIKRPISVQVGERPRPVENFTCYSPNWENLTCHWVLPHNFIKTAYKGSLVLKGRAARNPIGCKEADLKNNSCTFVGVDYHRAHKEFVFVINGTNVLGSTIQNFTIINHDVVIPNPPKDVQILNRTSHSCLIKWAIPFSVHLLPVGLSVIIQVKNSWDTHDAWETLNTSAILIKTANFTYNITNLKYAGTGYDIRIYLKSPNNAQSSDAAVKICNTLPIRPSAPPKTTPGCYDKIYNHNPILNIYWKVLDYFLRNGENFGYRIECLRNNFENCTHYMAEKTNTYAKFIMPSGMDTYNFSIFSSNEVGLSETFSSVYVPILDTVTAPYRPVKMTFGEGAYGITWSHGNNQVPHRYTVFYCEDEKERPLPCKGLIDWVEVSGNVTAKNITVKNKEKFHHFGVSAVNENGESSGISWATCVVSPDADLTVTELATHLVLSQTAQVTWQLGCAERSPLGGFILYYCPVEFSEDSNICNGQEERINITDSLSRNITITNLNPYTTYIVEMAVYNEAGIIGRKSSPIRFITFEDAPDPPTKLKSNNITHSSVNLTWELPVHKNGAILRFFLHLNISGTHEKTIQIDVEDKNKIDVSYEVGNLKSLTTYEFSLEACTQAKCSEKSLPYEVTTLMHKPDIMHSPRVFIVNRTSANVSWDPPNFLSPSHIYQIQVQLASQNIQEKTWNYSGEAAVVPIEELCTAYKNVIQFRMRAINVDDENGIIHAPEWSKPESARCDSAQDGYFFYVVLLCIIIISFLVTSGLCASFLLKQGYINCKEMKDVVVKLPSGLEPPPDLEKSTREIWPPAHRNNEHVITKITCNGSDEEKLLSNASHSDDSYKQNTYPGSSSISECQSLGCSNQSHETEDSQIISWGQPIMNNPVNEEIRMQLDIDNETDSIDVEEEEPDTSDSADTVILPEYSRVGLRVDATANDGYVKVAESGRILQSFHSPYKKISSSPTAMYQGDIVIAASSPLHYVLNYIPDLSGSNVNRTKYEESATTIDFGCNYPIANMDNLIEASELDDELDAIEDIDLKSEENNTTPNDHSGTTNYVPHQVLQL